MARLAGVDIPRDKRVVIALTYIYGIGRTRSAEILASTEINGDIRVKDLTDDQLVALRDFIEGTYKVEGDLRREVAADIRGRAARYGLGARVIADTHGRQVSVRDDLLETIARLEPVAADLGAADELRGVGDILSRGSSASRQLAVADGADGDLRAVVRHLIAEFHAGAPARPWPPSRG